MSDKFFVKDSKYVTHSVTQAPSSENVVSQGAQGSGGQPAPTIQQPAQQPPVAHVSYSQGNPAHGAGNYAEPLHENHFVGRQNQLGPLPPNSKNPLKSDNPVKSVASLIFTVVVALIALGIFTRIVGGADTMNRFEDPINMLNQFDRQYGTDLPSDWQETLIYEDYENDYEAPSEWDDDYDDSYSPSEWDDFDVEYLLPGTDLGF